MNKKHELEWVYQPGYNMAECTYVEMNDDFTQSHFQQLMVSWYEIQRIEIELLDGYTHTVQSRTRNSIGFRKYNITVSGSTGQVPHPEVFHYDRWTFRTKDVRQVRIWYDTPAYVPMERKKPCGKR